MRNLKRMLLYMALMFNLACYHDADLSFEPPRPDPPPPGFLCAPDTVYFANTVYPVILTSCATSGCHDQSTQKGGLELDTYPWISTLVVPFNPQASELYIRLFSNSGGRMPPDAPLSQEKKSIIYWWIAQGGYNNRCDSAGCDSLNVTYTSTINPIIQLWCIGCHSGSKPGGNILLETYDQVVAAANSGKLMGAIRWESGFAQMPKAGGPLSPCNIDLFEKWIRTGKPM
jgi:hypothetical protein